MPRLSVNISDETAQALDAMKARHSGDVTLTDLVARSVEMFNVVDEQLAADESRQLRIYDDRDRTVTKIEIERPTRTGA